MLDSRLRAVTSWRPGPAASRRSSVALGLVLLLACGAALVSNRTVARDTSKAQKGVAAADLFQDARYFAAREDAELNEYLSSQGQSSPAEFTEAAARLNASLRAIVAVEDDAGVRELIQEQGAYVASAERLITMLMAGRTAEAGDFQRLNAEPILDHMTADLGNVEEAQHERSTAQLETVRAHAAALLLGTPFVLMGVMLLLIGLSLVTRGYRRNIEDQALHDALTGLPNRLLFANRATLAIASASRTRAQPVVIMLDLDRFKEVNDTLGHHQGDRLLIEVATRIGRVLRASDTVSRLGGDEFAILLGDGGSEHGTRIAQRVATALEPAFYLDGVTVSVEASMGIASLSAGHAIVHPAAPAETAADLLQQADIAMYEAKMTHSGFAHFHTEADGTPPARLALLGELREALNRDELVLHYQPKVSADTGDLLGVEALVRWQHPTRGLLPPSEFIALAEATTLIQPLTSIVLDKALALSREWLDLGVRMPVAVNVSARSLLDLSFPSSVAAQLFRARVPADHLCLELTESTIMADPDRALTILQELRDLGVKLSVDDFGTGYSSMAYLKVLPVDELKIDRSFVSHMNTSADDTTLVQSAIDLGHNLGMTVVAEGVEDQETLASLKILGADALQGYYLGRPMSGTLLRQWVEARQTAAACEPHLPAPATS